MYAPTPEQQYPTPLAGAMCQAASLLLLHTAAREDEEPTGPQIDALQRASMRWGTLAKVC